MPKLSELVQYMLTLSLSLDTVLVLWKTSCTTQDQHCSKGVSPYWTELRQNYYLELPPTEDNAEDQLQAPLYTGEFYKCAAVCLFEFVYLSLPPPAEEIEVLLVSKGSSSVCYAIVWLWGSGVTVRDRNMMDKLVRRASSVLGCPFDSIQKVANRRIWAKLPSIVDNTFHPLHRTVESLSTRCNTVPL